MIKKTSALVGLLAVLTAPVSMAGSPVNISIPDNLVPTEGSEVRNPVTLEGTEFVADETMTESMTYYGAEFFVGQWDEVVLGWSKDIDLPFTFTLLGEEYTQLRVYRDGNVTLLPASYDGGYVRRTDSLRSDGWTDVNDSFYQGIQYPSIFALSKNNTVNDNWGFEVEYEYQLVNNQIEGAYIRLLEDQVVIYIDGYLDRSYQFNRGEDIPEDEFYDLKQAIVIHQSGDIDLHFDTTAPIAEMHADLSVDEAESGRLSERFYSGVVIPEAITGGNALLFVNHVTSGGQQSYSLTADQIAAIEELPTDGAPFDAGAPVKAGTPQLDSLYIPDSYAAYSESNTVELDVKLNAGETYTWTMRHLVQETFVDNEVTEYYVNSGDWSESTSFKTEEDDDDELLGAMGYLNLLLLFVLIRRFK